MTCTVCNQLPCVCGLNFRQRFVRRLSWRFRRVSKITCRWRKQKEGIESSSCTFDFPLFVEKLKTALRERLQHEKG